MAHDSEPAPHEAAAAPHDPAAAPHEAAAAHDSEPAPHEAAAAPHDSAAAPHESAAGHDSEPPLHDPATPPREAAGPEHPAPPQEVATRPVGSELFGESMREEAGEDRPRRDQWRPVRRTVAQVTIAFTVLFLVPLIQLVLGVGDRPKVERGPAAWVVWIASLAVMVTSALIALKVLRATDRATEVRLTWWCGGLWVAGFVLTTIYSSLLG